MSLARRQGDYVAGIAPTSPLPSVCGTCITFLANDAAMLALYVRSMNGGRQRLDIGTEKTLAKVRAQLEKKTLIVENVVQLQQFCLATSLTMGSPPRPPSQRSITASGSWIIFRHV